VAEQTFSNHARFYPLFHFVLVPLLAINLVNSLYAWFKLGFSLAGFFQVLLAVALVLGFGAARLMALTVQDRVIRLEERLRYERLLPADLKPRIGDFTMGQMVSLRFASDQELPALARKVLDEKMNQRKAIKQLVKTWKPDYLRA